MERGRAYLAGRDGMHRRFTVDGGREEGNARQGEKREAIMEGAWWSTMSNSVDMQLPRSLSRVARPAYTRRITRVPRVRFVILALSYANSSVTWCPGTGDDVLCSVRR